MKKLILAIILIVPLSIFAQSGLPEIMRKDSTGIGSKWNQIGFNLSPTFLTSKVGIGSTTPITNFHIFSSGATTSLLQPATFVNGMAITGATTSRFYLENLAGGVNLKTLQFDNSGGVFSFNSVSDSAKFINRTLFQFDIATGNFKLNQYPLTRTNDKHERAYLSLSPNGEVGIRHRWIDFNPPAGNPVSYQMLDSTYCDIYEFVPFSTSKAQLYLLPKNGGRGQHLIFKNMDGSPAIISSIKSNLTFNLTVPATTGTAMFVWDSQKWCYQGVQNPSISQVNTATYTVSPSDKTLRLVLANLQTITMPTTGTTVGQEVRIINATGYNKATSSIIGMNSQPTVFINSYESYTVQWDGTNWIKTTSTGENITQYSKQFGANVWNTGSIIIGNMEFAFNAVNISATTSVQARCVGSQTSLASSLNIVKYPMGGIIAVDAPQNPTFTTAYTVLSTASTIFNTNYTTIVYRIQDRGSVGLGNLGVYEITVQNDGSTNVTMNVKYMKGRQ